VDSKAKLLRGQGGGGAAWSGVAAAAGCPAPAEAMQGDALGFGRLRQGEMVGAEGHRGHFKKAQASWAGVPRNEISPGIQAGLARPLHERCAGETKLPAGPAGQRHRKRAQASAWGKDSAPTSGAGESATPSGRARDGCGVTGRRHVGAT